MDYHYNARHQDHTAGNRRQNLMHNVYSPPAHGSRTQGMPLLTEPCEMYETDAEFQIHSMEREAYGSVLRAFIAQSDLLSWGKEGLITELRKELNVTDIEHGQLLGEINSDETVKRIREWRKVSLESQSGKVTATGIPSSVVCITSPNRKRSSHPSLSQPRKLVSESQPTMPLSVPACLRNKRSLGELGTVRSQAYTHNIQELPKDKGRAVQSQPRKGIQAPDSFNMEQCSDIIQIRATDKLIHEVEKMTYELDPIQVEKAKSLLREHERVILGALEKLADISDDDDSPNPHHYYEEAEGNLPGMLINNLGQGGILHGYPSEVHFQTQSTRSRIPCVNIQSEDDDEAT